MTKFKVCCVGCKRDFPLNTEDPSDMIESFRAANAPQILIKHCPYCSKRNRVPLPK